MERNLTKDKGDKGLAYVIADLTEKEYYICLPLAEHLPFDLVAVNNQGLMVRVQVKFRNVSRSGCIEVKFASTWSNRKGTHLKAHDFGAFDGYAVYCPETKLVYYIPSREMSGRTAIWLRVKEDVLLRSSMRFASGYTDPGVMF